MKLRVEEILFPFDFSAQCLLAVPFVRALALRLEAKVTLFGAVPPIWDITPVGSPLLAGADIAGWRSELQSRLEQALTEELSGVVVDRIAVLGDPALRITEFAQTTGVDLIMMPTHGFGLFRSLLIGSTTAKVLHDAPCAVWTATHAEEQRGRPLPRRILCALDGTAGNAALLQWVAAFSAQLGASLRLLHVVRPITDWPSLERERVLQDEARDEAHATVESIRKAAGVDAPLRVAVGEIVATVAEEARQDETDLVVIGRGSVASTLGRLRTHAYGIIQRSPCPVLSI